MLATQLGFLGSDAASCTCIRQARRMSQCHLPRCLYSCNTACALFTVPCRPPQPLSFRHCNANTWPTCFSLCVAASCSGTAVCLLRHPVRKSGLQGIMVVTRPRGLAFEGPCSCAHATVVRCQHGVHEQAAAGSLFHEMSGSSDSSCDASTRRIRQSCMTNVGAEPVC